MMLMTSSIAGFRNRLLSPHPCVIGDFRASSFSMSTGASTAWRLRTFQLSCDVWITLAGQFALGHEKSHGVSAVGIPLVQSLPHIGAFPQNGHRSKGVSISDPSLMA